MDKPVLSPDFIHKKQQRIFCVQARTEENMPQERRAGCAASRGKKKFPYSNKVMR